MFDLPSAISWQPLTLPHAWTGAVRAQSNNTRYQVFARFPDRAPPSEGFPVVYLLDADDLFVGVAEALRRASRRPESTGIAPAVLVGIDHAPSNAPGNTARRRDYTAGPCATETTDEPVGGALALLDFITGQLAPMIEDGAKIDPTRRGLLGHSLAGYFSLWALVSRPQAFSHYAAISPSIWWDPAALQIPPASTGADANRPRAYLAAGEWEGEPAPWQRALASDPVGLERRRRRDMIGRARGFADALARKLPADAVHLDLLAGEDHSSVVNPAITRALRFMQAPTT